MSLSHPVSVLPMHLEAIPAYSPSLPDADFQQVLLLYLPVITAPADNLPPDVLLLLEDSITEDPFQDSALYKCPAHQIHTEVLFLVRKYCQSRQSPWIPFLSSGTSSDSRFPWMLRQLLPVAVHKLKAVLEKCICTVWMQCLGTASIPADWQLHLLPPLPSAVPLHIIYLPCATPFHKIRDCLVQSP